MALLVIGSDRAQSFAETARSFAPDRDIRLHGAHGAEDEVEYALAWQPPVGALKTFPNLKLIVSVGAGVDHLFRDRELPAVPVSRYVDPDLTTRMTEYIVLHTLLHTRRLTEYQSQQRNTTWRYLPEATASQVRVGIMGLGVLGQAAATALLRLGYQVRGWSRSAKSVDGVACFAGTEGLDAFLDETDILAVLLPLTPATEGLIDRSVLKRLSRSGRHPRMPGPVLINAGRGKLQVEADILAALEAGELYAASLDVFETEPLPAESPLWGHPRVIVTPHNAAESADESIVSYFLRQVERVERGEDAENIVDPKVGY
jgi:glyoxylate/hydroxypyruvate reductase A